MNSTNLMNPYLKICSHDSPFQLTKTLSLDKSTQLNTDNDIKMVALFYFGFTFSFIFIQQIRVVKKAMNH
jgi:hypothetical protein